MAAVLLGADVDLEGAVRAPVFHRVADEVLEQPGELRAVGSDDREGRGVDRRVRALDLGVQVRQGAVHGLAGVGGAHRAHCFAGEGVAQQVVDQRAHALGGAEGPLDEVLGVSDKLAGRALGEHLEVAHHRDQRVAQVVGHDLGELLELGVRTGQLLRLLLHTSRLVVQVDEHRDLRAEDPGVEGLGESTAPTS